MNTFHKYASVTALLAIGCSSSTQQAKVNDPVPVEPDCSSLDLTQKVDFFTSFTHGEDRFCYLISSRGEHYFDAIGNCDEQERPLPKSATVTREFAGPKVGYMELKLILAVSGYSIDYIQFYREPSGEIGTNIAQNSPMFSYPDDIGQLLQNGIIEGLFQSGVSILDETKNYPPVCKELVRYKSTR
ncbi:MAG: hypothetical protein Q7S55_03120 [Nanoarchaeota archaeon]|nr:hypothetical protein [Nanoarchaeota archaeon]